MGGRSEAADAAMHTESGGRSSSQSAGREHECGIVPPERLEQTDADGRSPQSAEGTEHRSPPAAVEPVPHGGDGERAHGDECGIAGDSQLDSHKCDECGGESPAGGEPGLLLESPGGDADGRSPPPPPQSAECTAASELTGVDSGYTPADSDVVVDTRATASGEFDPSSRSGESPAGRGHPDALLWKLVLERSALTQLDAYRCMQVCRLWHECVHKELVIKEPLWRDIKVHCVRVSGSGLTLRDQWTDTLPAAVAAKGPKAISITAYCKLIAFGRREHEAGRAPPPPMPAVFGLTRRRLAALLAANPQLRRLSLFNCDAQTLRGLDALTQPLDYLDLSRSYGLDAAAFAAILRCVPALKSLGELRGVDLTGDKARAIAESLTHLTELRTAGADLEGVRRLSHLDAHTRTTLRTVHLLQSRMHWRAITIHILAMESLQSLRLHQCPTWTFRERCEEDRDEWKADLQLRYMRLYKRPIDVYF